MWILELVGVLAKLVLITSLLTSRVATYPSSILSHHHHLMIHVAGASIWSHHHHPMSSFALLPTSHQVDSTWRRHHHLRHPWRSKTLAKQPLRLLTQPSIALSGHLPMPTSRPDSANNKSRTSVSSYYTSTKWSFVRLTAPVQAVNESVMRQCSWEGLWRICVVCSWEDWWETTHGLWSLQLTIDVVLT